MEIMRKFIIDLKPDGTMKWAEVAEPHSGKYVDDIQAVKAFDYVEQSLKTYPKCFWTEECKASFINGASEMLHVLGFC